MKRLHFWQFIILAMPLAAVAATPNAVKPSAFAHSLVNQILERPGAYDQMCSGWSDTSIFAVPPIPAYGVIGLGPRMIFISADNFQKLRNNRDAVVSDLVARLKEFDPELLEKDRFATNPIPRLNSNVLLMLVDLNAVEALPELLRLEALFNRFPSDPAQATIEDLNPIFRQAYDSNPNSLRVLAKSQTQGHRNLLGVIAAILRQERFSPLLNSDLEKQFLAGIKEGRFHKRFRDIKRPEDLSPNQAKVAIFDPVHSAAYLGREAVLIEYSPGLRDQIVGWAQDFLTNVPPEKRKAEQGMVSPPVDR